MSLFKLSLYGVMVACFLVAGVCDVVQGQYKLGVVSCLFGVSNAVIFFWR